MQDLYSYWGKTDDENNYHLLVYHCLDVAAVADIYLTEHPELLESIAAGLGLKRNQVKALLLFFIVLHDLGKFSICFQSKNPEVFSKLNPSYKPRDNSNYHHDVLGAAIWDKHIYQDFKTHIKKSEEVCIKEAFKKLMDACVGHHGKPAKIKNETNLILKAFDAENIIAAKAFVLECKQLFLAESLIDLSDYEDEGELEDRFSRVSWWLSGLTILADWLGSNREYFTYCQENYTLADYWEKIARINARRALAQSGLSKVTIAPHQDYKVLFNISSPRPLQEYVKNVVLPGGPQLFILEDMTGSGKTEAALMLAYRLMEAEMADGLYFALPTMATANGIYKRVSEIGGKFFSTPGNVSIILAHANNKLAKLFRDSIQHSPTDQHLKHELSSATAYCNVWFADNRKKALLANLGVGTIDQALQCILPNRHQSLRLIGLFRKVLIVDEVHACDAYMLELLKTLITFHTAGGGSTILLSATLPQKMRQALANAFYTALITDHKIYLPTKNDYPLATQCYIGKEYDANDIVAITPIKAFPELCRTVNIQLCDDKSSIEKIILEKLAAGLCVCWIRNTVTDAIETCQQFMKDYEPEKITLFHARFTMHDRYQLEDRINKLFGKNSSRSERQGQLVIATQVVEQSLDLDFDFIVTDLAPIDLIIQRMGRLQRHKREEKRPPATLLVYSPMPIPEAEQNWYSVLFPKAARVYENHAQLWLTAKLLSEHLIVKVPEHVRDFIEYVYSENYLEHAPKNLEQQADKMDGKARGNRENAKLTALKLNSGYQNVGGIDWWEDIYAPIRLSEHKTVHIYFAKWNGSVLTPWHEDEEGFAWEMSSINAPDYYFPKNTTSVTHPLLKAIPECFTKKQNLLVYDLQQQLWFYLKQEDENVILNNLVAIAYSSQYGLQKRDPR